MYKGLKVFINIYLENIRYKILNQNNWLACALMAACLRKSNFIIMIFIFYQNPYLCPYEIFDATQNTVIPVTMTYLNQFT